MRGKADYINYIDPNQLSAEYRDRPLIVLSGEHLFYYLTGRVSPIEEHEFLLYLIAIDAVTPESAHELADPSEFIERIDVSILSVENTLTLDGAPTRTVAQGHAIQVSSRVEEDGQCVVTDIDYYTSGDTQRIRRYLVLGLGQAGRGGDQGGDQGGDHGGDQGGPPALDYVVESTLTMKDGTVHARRAVFVRTS